MTVEQLIDGILVIEGDKFTNDPSDSGGPTKYGITQVTLSEWMGRPATIADVANLKRQVAFDLLLHRYYIRPAFDKIAKISTTVAEKLTDLGVLCGPARAGIFLQRSLNALNLNGTKYPDVAVDGDCGQRTRDALTAYTKWRGAEGETVMVRALNCLFGEHSIDLAEKRPKDEKYVYGWLLHRAAP